MGTTAHTISIPIPILTLASLTALAPLAIDAYLPAMAAIAADYQVSIHAVELSLSLFLAGFALGQLIGGPFSDRMGRRISIFIGLGIFLFGTAGIVFSPTLEWMWFFRVLQAFGGGLAIVNPAAIIRDLSSGLDSARNLSHMAIIMMLAPLMAPMIGTLILHLSQWQGIFVFLFVYGLFIGLIILLRLPETKAANSERPSALNRYWQVLSHRCAMGYCFSQSFAFGGLFAFITASPVVYMDYFGVSETVYPFLFGGNVVGLMLFNRINVLLLRTFQPNQLLRAGQVSQLLVCLALVSYVMLVVQPLLWPVVTLIVLFACCSSLIASNATACCIEYFPHNSATATALLGANGFLTGALSGAAVGLLGDGTPRTMAIVMLSCAAMGLLLRNLLHSTGIAARPKRICQ